MRFLFIPFVILNINLFDCLSYRRSEFSFFSQKFLSNFFFSMTTYFIMQLVSAPCTAMLVFNIYNKTIYSHCIFTHTKASSHFFFNGRGVLGGGKVSKSGFYFMIKCTLTAFLFFNLTIPLIFTMHSHLCLMRGSVWPNYCDVWRQFKGFFFFTFAGIRNLTIWKKICIIICILNYHLHNTGLK